MLPKKGHSVEKKYFLYSIIKIYDVNCYLKLKKIIFCNLTIFELVNRIGDFESLCNACTRMDEYSMSSHFVSKNWISCNHIKNSKWEIKQWKLEKVKFYYYAIIADLFEFPGILHAYLSIFGFGYITSYTPLALKFKILNFSFLGQIDMLYFGHCCWVAALWDVLSLLYWRIWHFFKKIYYFTRIQLVPTSCSAICSQASIQATW